MSANRSNRSALCSALTLGVLASVLVPASAEAALWRNTTAESLGTQTAGWTNKVDLADVNGDGRVDILFANGSAYNQPGEKQLNGVWLNVGNDTDGNPMFEDASEATLGTEGDFTRVIKGRDVTGDGNVDIIVGNTYETQSRLFLGDGEGNFTEATELLPQVDASIGDLEIGDVDGDGDLDIVLADWGLDGGDGELLDPFTAPGGQMLVWLNDIDNTGKFIDATDTAMPADALVAWSWEMELIDVDNDFDLDIMASCKVCEGSSLFINDGGEFTLSGSGLPQFTNNYDFEPMFIKLPGEETASLAVVTINDGEQASPGNQFDLRERMFVTGGDGRFTDMTSELWPDEQNAGRDDNMVVILDADSDGDPDFLIGALGPEDDRLHMNRLDEDGTFHLDVNDGIETGLAGTPGTLGIALADLNGDGKLDVVQSQGELADPEAVWVGDDIAPDTAAPIVQGSLLQDDGEGDLRMIARVHDNKSPSRPHDWDAVVVRTLLNGEEIATQEMAWTGEFYWRTDKIGVDGLTENDELTYQVCARDAAGNEGCGEEINAEDKADDASGHADGSGSPNRDDEGDSAGGCSVGPQHRTPSSMLLLLLGVLVARRRRE
jgi:MYXO-CTERM domain-containing protein